MACDADTHYMCNAMVYLGKNSVQVPRGMTQGEVFTGALVEPFYRGGRTVTTDNFFTTVPLALSLAAEGMHLCGTIRPKPYIPKELYERRLKIKDSVAVFNYEHSITLQCQQVNPTKKVMILSTAHHNPSVIEKSKTELQMFYNATKGGVDTFDQLCSLTNCIRKTRRWPMCLFFGMVNIAMVNAHILFSLRFPEKRGSRKAFLKTAALELCTPLIHRRFQSESILPRNLRSVMKNTLQLGNITPPALHAVGHTKLDKRRRCRACPSSQDRKTNTACNRCNVPVCIAHQSVVCPACLGEYIIYNHAFIVLFLSLHK